MTTLPPSHKLPKLLTEILISQEYGDPRLRKHQTRHRFSPAYIMGVRYSMQRHSLEKTISGLIFTYTDHYTLVYLGSELPERNHSVVHGTIQVRAFLLNHPNDITRSPYPNA